VSEFDWSVGEIVAALQRLGLADDTLVVVTSDNGPWFEGSPGGLRGRKGQSYEGGFRVPFVAWWPGRVPAGSVSDVPAMNIDLFPTFLGLAGLALPADRVIDGVDLWPVLAGERADLGERPRLPATGLGGVGSHAGHLAAALSAGSRPRRGLQPGRHASRADPRAPRATGGVAHPIPGKPARLALIGRTRRTPWT
jgi:hypothetical protein